MRGFAASAALVVKTPLPRLVPGDRTVPLIERITHGAQVMVQRPVLRGLLGP
ncbi:hypothetical protein [Nocardia sp. SC052]|uniref:hypothetical protein n=1 Tax=Nocardia sichangensis TaxID=3385975 RepID=UPI0039A2B43A